ncbi:MAG: hypothetical protein HY513_01235 [Candidatus Aenigmarchaeota archaeon]|nr:hypothetical protein [Candidatus Aenigmarchaeota archaeon]
MQIKQKGSDPKIENEYYGLPTARAFENQAFFVMCDAESTETVGQSRILSPVSELARIGKEGTISVDVDLQNLEELRRRYDCWKE